ncbi:MAG: exo-alpha-sialidase [Chloroflexi bacterium]|nr:exo-alpha-sialidase [Chloroflexota bacterium]
MAKSVAILVGTKKGLWVFRSGAARQRWRAEGPYFAGQAVYHAAFDPRDGETVWAGVNATWGGPRIEVSHDLGRTWTIAANPAFPAGDDRTFARTWHIEAGHASQPGVVWAGTEPASLFRSGDRGHTWEPVRSLNDHPEHAFWSPGGGGLGLHSIAIDPADARSMTIGISSGGVYDTTDGGKTWTNGNAGTRSPIPVPDDPYVLRCVHHLVAHPTVPGVRFQQGHAGVYFRPAGAAKWTERSKGLPTDYGFSAAIHPHDADTAYVIPLEFPVRQSPAPSVGVYRTRDAGKTWKRLTKGLPKGDLEVMREGLATDRLDPAGVYFGSSNGEVWASRDEGHTWAQVSAYLPYVLSVSTATG